ncbi:DUF436 domain-containing protein [Pseudoalteromonas sp. S2755]|uniref:DUF436 domain-containing protein n=1 Tax=Pseudoalteromonas sp. S2755 TaxID=2066523 RepID=UPI00110B3663|nr:DUF436 domain-containing protein [Pseudoalteromonas sp. S2755]TMN34227.1 hypothetical protein CWC03_17060 [Pseudoalteromonas sp. S2755]
MKYFLYLSVLIMSLCSTYVHAERTILCNACSPERSQKLVEEITRYEGERVYVVDLVQSSPKITLYKSVLDLSADEVNASNKYHAFSSEYHGPDSVMSLQLKEKLIEVQKAVEVLHKRTAEITLPVDGKFESAFQIAIPEHYFLSKIATRIQTDKKVRNQFTLIHTQLKQLKADLGLDIGLTSLGLNLKPVLVINFKDGTSAWVKLDLLTTNGAGVAVEGSLMKALDKQGQVIPIGGGVLGVRLWAKDRALNEETAGSMKWLTEWLSIVEDRGVPIYNPYSGGRGNASTSIKD